MEYIHITNLLISMDFKKNKIENIKNFIRKCCIPKDASETLQKTQQSARYQRNQREKNGKEYFRTECEKSRVCRSRSLNLHYTQI